MVEMALAFVGFTLLILLLLFLATVRYLPQVLGEEEDEGEHGPPGSGGHPS